MMINKIIANAMIIFALSLIAISTAGATTVSISNGTAAPDGTVVVPLMINDVTGAGSVEVNLTYNSSVVIPINVTNSNFDMPPQDPPINPESGYVIINAMQFATGLNGNVKIGDITLQAVGSEGESSPLNLADAILQDMAMQDIPVGRINGTFTIPPTGTESGGSGNGGSSGGGSSSEAYTNIVLKETRCVYVSKDELTSYKFEKPMNDIVYVNFTAITHAGDVCTMVEILSNTSTSVETNPPDNVYKNINIWVGLSGYATEKNIRDASITFRVDRTWINNASSSTIALNVYHNNSWHPLNTMRIGEDHSYIYFTAGTGYFGRFAITARNARAIPVQTSIDKPVPEQTSRSSEQATPPGHEAEETSRSIPGFNVLPGLIGLVIACLLRRR